MRRARRLLRSARRPPFAMGCALALLMAACDKGAAKHDPPQRHQIPAFVTVGEVKAADIPIVLKLNGTIQATMIVKIIPRVSGYIDKRFFVEGTYVKKGAPLYLIDPRPFEDRLKKLKAELRGSEATQAFATAEVARYKKAGETGAVSQERIDESVAKLEEAEASADAIRAAIEMAELDLSYAKINAAFDGRIQNTLINVGNLVTAEKDVLTSLVKMDPVYVVFNLSRRKLYEMQRLLLKGLVSSDLKKLKVEILLPDGSVYKERGFVDFVSAEVDPTTDMLMVRAILPNPQERKGALVFVPGQYATVRLIAGKRSGALLIPQKALVETQGSRHVFVLDKDNKASARKVEVGTTYMGQWVVENGLTKGERIVVDGVQKVRPGTVVKVAPPPGKKPEKS